MGELKFNKTQENAEEKESNQKSRTEDRKLKLSPQGLHQGYFKSLTHLDISGQSTERLDLKSLNRLEWLCCANNNLEVLLLSGTSLTYLDCSHNNLLSISVDPVPNNLSTLQVSFNNLEDLPTWTWLVPELFIVQASHNRLRQLDCKYQNSLSNLPIRELQLHCNKIEFVSKDFIQRATRLKLLNLSRNMIEHMPNFGKRCPIQELSMSRNNLRDSEERDALEFLVDCGQLKRLYMAFNNIERVSERCVSSWKNLEELILCGNRIKSLPAKISSLTNLRVFRVHCNNLEVAPNLTKMPALKMVDMSHNSLRKINLDHLISGGNLTYLDISCNERLSLNAEKLSTQNQKRPMNLVEVTQARRRQSVKPNDVREFPANPPWEIGFSELPDKNLVLSVSQYRDTNISNGREALFGLFDGGEGHNAPKYISKSIAKIYAEETNIEETHGFSLKYTLLNAMKSIKQQGYSRPLQGILCLLSTHEDPLYQGKSSFYLNLAMVGGIRCVLVESGKKITRLTDVTELGLENKLQLKDGEETGNEAVSYESNTNGSETSSNKSSSSSGENNLNGNIPDPRVLSIPLSTSVEYLIIGNQSVWNHVHDSELIEELELHRQRKSVLVAKRLADMAQSHNCKQSISIIVVKFKWHIPTVKVGGDNNKGRGGRIRAGHNGDTTGPLSYYSGGSEFSDASNPMVSVITPDSAIDTDRSSGAGSVGSNGGSTKSASTNISDHNVIRPRVGVNENKENYGKGSKKSDRIMGGKLSPELDEDQASIANTSVSQISMEQFRCWEYMLEQNTRMLFKKELDTLSKGVFQRNNKQRKSVHFPYQQQSSDTPDFFRSPPEKVQKSYKSTHNINLQAPISSAGAPGFYTLSKAKSLSHLFAGDQQTNKVLIPADPPQPIVIPKPVRSVRPMFGAASGLLGSMRSSAKRAILGGPNAAYFSSSQRQANAPPNTGGGRESQEIQEVKNFDSIEHESRLKRYWENKITEL